MEIRLSEESAEAARNLAELGEGGKLFGDNGLPQSGAEVEEASRSLGATLAADVLRELGEQSGGRGTLRVLNPEKPSVDAIHIGGHWHAFLKVELGGGRCAYGHYEYPPGVCVFDGIASCDLDL